MATTTAERINSQQISGRQAVLRYTIKGAADASAAKTAMLAEAPSTFSSLPRRGSQATIENAQAAAGDLWYGEVPYSYTQGREYASTGQSMLTLNIGGGTINVKSSLETVSSVAAGGGTAPDFDKAINVEVENGVTRVNGVEIYGGGSFLEERHYLDIATVTPAYLRNLMRHANPASYNDAAFRGFSAGEVLFLGARGSKRGYDGTDYEFTFQFAISENQSNVPFGGLTVASKLGWHFLWGLWAKSTSGTSVVTQAKAAYVERVYRSWDFSELQIGTDEWGS